MRIPTFAVIALALFASVLQAQQPRDSSTVTPDVPVGARVRAYVPAAGKEGLLVGTVKAVSPSDIQIVDARTGEPWTVPWKVGQVEISRGQQTRGYGARAGVIGGFIFGEALGVIAVHPDVGRPEQSLGVRTVQMLKTPSVLAVGIGAAIGGYFVGSHLRGEKWERVVLPNDVGVVPLPDGSRAVSIGWTR